MADVPGKFFSATKVRTGVAPSSSGSLVGEPLPPVNPPGSSLNSVGLTMPSAFTVSNSPLTANGTIGVAGAGTVGQYIRGDGSLADFPESSGGGSSVSYYLNGSISQGTIGGVAYKEMNKVPILGAGTDFTINADGYIASFLTDVGDPNLLEIPGGNWNFETYFSASSSGGTPTFYVELYKYDGTTFTLIASSVSAPELIAFGTTLTPYFSSLAVPTTTLALTDRLAVRYYVTHSGRTITMHTENNHLCQIITTFTTGLTALNGLTAQVQNFAVGTSGTDFNIASATATHTFNLPTASATNRGALSSADWSLFTQAYNDKINSAAVTGTTTKTLTLTQQDGGTITASWSDLNTDAVLSVFGRTGAVVAANGDYTTAQVTESGNLYYTEARVSANTDVAANTAARHNAVTLGTANGLSLSTQQLSLALASGSTTGALSSTDWTTFNNKQNALGYVPVPETRTITINGTSQDLSANRTYNVGTVTSVAALTLGTSGTDLSSTVANGTTTPVITLNVPTASATNRGALSATDWTTFNNKQNTLSLTTTGTSGAATLIGATLNIPQYQAAGTYVTSVTASSPLASSGGTTPNITIQQASGSQNGFLSSTDWTTFNNKVSSQWITTGSNIYYTAGSVLIGTITAPSPVAGVSFPLVVSSSATTRIQINSTQATPNAGVGLYANGVQKFSFAMFGATSDFTIYNDALLQSALLVKGDTNNIIANGTLSIEASATGSTTTQVPVFISDPASTTRELFTRTPAQFRSDIGAQAALTNPVTGTGTTNYLPKFTGSTTIGNSALYDGGGFGGFNSTGLGSRTFVINAASGRSLALELIENANVHAIYFRPNNSGYNLISSNYISGGVYLPLSLSARENNADLVLATSGNLGLGVTPSAWDTNVNVRALQMNAGSIWGFSTVAFLMVQNSFSNTSGIRTYVNNGFASEYEQASGQHIWKTAPSGTAGNAISFTQAMTLFATGNLLVGTPSPISDNGARLQVSGDITTSNNTANVRVNINNTTTTTGRSWYLNSYNNGNLYIGNGTAGDIFNFSSTGAATFSSSVTAATLTTIGTAVAGQNVQLNLNGVSGKAQRIEFQNSGVQQWLIGAGAASETTAFEIFNSTGVISLSINKSTNAATFSSFVNATNLRVFKSGFRGGLFAYNDITGSGDDHSITVFAESGTNNGNIYFCPNGSSTRAMTINTSGNVLIGTTTDNGSKLRVNGSLALPHVTKSANYTLDGTDYTVGFDCASNRTATLPDATTCSGRIYVIYQYNTGSGARSVTLDGNGSQTINGATTYSLSPYCDFTSVMIQSNGSNWIIIASNLTADCL